ncbi:L-carnitine dehydratase [Mycobacteroides abscessus subsp. abscessus]|nr:L-carnitine dehydratase [Mycobacteroides abscessus subsp. abscessus]
MGNDKQFRLLAQALEMPRLARDDRFATNPLRVRHRGELVRVLEQRLREKNADDWYDTLTAVGVPAGPINDIAEAFRFAERIGLDVAVTVPDSPERQVANPVSMSETPVVYRNGPPRLARDDRFATNPLRVRHRGELVRVLEQRLREKNADDWYDTLTAVGVPAGPINDIAEAFRFAERIGLDVAVTVPDSPERQVANPVSMSETPVVYRNGPPRLGQSRA